MHRDTNTRQVARGWDHALTLLTQDSWRAGLGRFRSPFAFRGQGCLAGSLSTSLSRLAPDPARLESHLLRNFRKYAWLTDERPPSTIWDWLALAQHHGLPTRLLDWTYSPLVALHFATVAALHAHEDGVVWCVDYGASRAQLPRRLQRVLARDGSEVFTPELLGAAAPALGDLERLAARPFAIFLEPPALDHRIVAQYALFSLLSRASATMADWLRAHAPLYRAVVIPARIKPEIRDQLDQANITERVLFPGLDGLCRWLARYYRAAGTSAPVSEADAEWAEPSLIAGDRGVARRTTARPRRASRPTRR